jgi:hypothetical protein
MSLSDLASLGSFVSGLAILISLIFLFFQLRQIGEQIRQAERNQQASIRTTRAWRTMDSLIGMFEPSAAEAFMMGGVGDEEMSPTQHAQYALMCQSRLINLEDAFYQHKDGLLAETAFSSLIATLRAAFSQPGLRAGWQILRAQFAGEFVQFIDHLIAETPVATPSRSMSDLSAQWKAAFATERAEAKPI